MANGQENLIPFNERTEEEKRKIAIMGGKASGEARREKATFKKMLERVLDEKADDGKTYREKIAMGQIKSAIDGKAENFKILLQVMGELEQTEEQETRPVQIIIKDNTNLEKVMYEDSD